MLFLAFKNAKVGLGTGGSLRVTGLVVINPHPAARENELDNTPAMFRTVFAESGRGCLVSA